MEKRLILRETTTADAAVDGLFAGIAGGLLMMLVLVIYGLLTGDGAEATLGLFDPREGGAAVPGGLTHLAVSAIYGALYLIIVRLLGGRWPAAWRFTWLLGVVYGLAIWLLAELVLLPASGSPLMSIPAPVFAVAHVVYGLTVGIVSLRLLKRAN